MPTIEFYFDFSSPYGYIASQLIDALGDKYGREVSWRPYQLGKAFKVTGAVPLVGVALKGEYAKRDFERSARQHGIPFKLPEPFPVNAAPAARAYYWAQARGGAAESKRVAQTLYRAYFAEGRNIAVPETVADVMAGLGFDRAAALAGIQSDEVKSKLDTVTTEAIARGAFGSPFIFVDGEAFWGADRLPMIDEWLRRGGW